MPDLLRLELLGGLRISLGDAPVTGFVSNKVQALLCYLAVSGRQHFRPALAALLWGDLPDADAATNLRQALTNLRRVLEPYLLITRQTVAFNYDQPYWIDVTQFEADLSAGISVPDLQRLTATVALYRGDFLDGFSVRDAVVFDEWVLTERERLRELALQAMQILVVQHANHGEYAPGIAAAIRLLALDPWREEAHQQLMLLLARSGQRSSALAQYETCRRVLAEQLGVEPLPETTALYERIRAASPPNRYTLPANPTAFVGREAERAILERWLADPSYRLITISGPGGIGKTRLALQAAADYIQHFLHGVYAVYLAPVGSPDLLATTIANGLQCSLSGSGTPTAQLLNHLHTRELLLVLDNFEHMIPQGVDLLAEILRRAPEVKLLVTSRERLQLQGEWLLELQGLTVPADAPTEPIETYSAVQLFFQSAKRMYLSFAPSLAEEHALVRICRLVEGMPLGIELAAAWVRLLSCADIAQEIERNLGFLATSLRDVPDRHRSLRAVFEQSWQLLSAEEQRIFRRLAVFQGGFTRAAVVCAELRIEHEEMRNQQADKRLLNTQCSVLNVLGSLVDKSLLRRNQAGRYEMHELIRQYATEKLAEVPEEQMQSRDWHCAYYVALLHERERHLKGAQQAEAIEAIGEDIENVRVAWNWALERRQLAQIDRCVESLFLFYETRGWFVEGVAAFNNAAECLEWDAAAAEGYRGLVLGRVLARQGRLYDPLSFYEKARDLLQRSLTIVSQYEAPQEIAFVLNRLASASESLGDHGEAVRLSEAALTIGRAIGDQFEKAYSLYVLGNIAYNKGEYVQAQHYWRECLELHRAIGDNRGIGHCLNNLGIAALYLGAYPEARELLQEGLIVHQPNHDLHGIATCLYNLGLTIYLQQEYDEARRFLQESLELRQSIADEIGQAHSLNGLGMVAFATGHYAEAKELSQKALATYRASGDLYMLSFCLHNLGDATCALEAYAEAAAYFREALQTAMTIQAIPPALHALVGMAGLLAKQAQREQAVQLVALIVDHPAAIKETRERAARLLSELSVELPTSVVAAAYERGRAHMLPQVVEELLLQAPIAVWAGHQIVWSES